MYIHACMHACTCTCTYTYTYTYTYAHTHARAHTCTHTHTHTDLSYPLKQSITEPRNDSLLLLAVRGTHHCVGLATPCLPVGKDAGVVALKGILQDVLPEALIDVHLVCRGGGKGWGGVGRGGEGWSGVGRGGVGKGEGQTRCGGDIQVWRGVMEVRVVRTYIRTYVHSRYERTYVCRKESCDMIGQ